MDIKTTIHFTHLYNSKKRVTVMQGGARSAKTYNILIFEIVRLLKENKPQTLTVVRKTLTAARGTVVRDFEEILDSFGIWDRSAWNKTTCEYRLGPHLIEFIGADSQKVRGRKRHRLFCNEANELSFEEFRQLALRTTDKIIIDFNPSDEYHWIYDEVIPRSDADFYVTTYKDNPYLDSGIIQEIEALQSDPEYWAVFGMGQRAAKKTTIYPRWEFSKYTPTIRSNQCGGIDFGYNDPSVIVTTYQEEGALHVKEWLYRSLLTAEDLAKFILSDKALSKITFYADSSRPEMIEALKRAGVDVRPVRKGPDSIKYGIDRIKGFTIKIDPDSSSNLIKEIKMYRWKEAQDGRATDEPVSMMDHAMDAMRYSIVGDGASPISLTRIESIKIPKPMASRMEF